MIQKTQVLVLISCEVALRLFTKSCFISLARELGAQRETGSHPKLHSTALRKRSKPS